MKGFHSAYFSRQSNSILESSDRLIECFGPDAIQPQTVLNIDLKIDDLNRNTK